MCRKYLLMAIFFLSPLSAYEVISEKLSYFRLDGQGQLFFSDRRPVPGEDLYLLPVKIIPSTTALIVMDPWIDMAAGFLNDYYATITNEKILPLVKQAKKTGHRVVILTNDPAKFLYNTKISPALKKLVDQKRVYLLYHQNYDDASFAKWLTGRNIRTLIYTGFASNQCLLARDTGMVMMRRRGFRLFFVPEASAAVETKESWDTQLIHHATTATISQWLGNIIHHETLMEGMSKSL